MEVELADGEFLFDVRLDFDGKLYRLIKYIVAGLVLGTGEVLQKAARGTQYRKKRLLPYFCFLYEDLLKT